MKTKNIYINAPLLALSIFSATTYACTEEELAAHNALNEFEKKAVYGFEGSGIPCSAEMKTLTAEWKELNSSEAKQRGREKFNKNKYGMFIHWGLYSSLGGVYKGKKMEDGGTGPQITEWIMRRKEIPRAEYAELAKDFNPKQFNADEWVAIAKAAGMKYIVMGSKHHEGFAMFKSDVSDFNMVDATPFGRDPIKEMEIATKKAGLDFGVYYSNSLDWRDGGDGGMKTYGPKPGVKARRAPMPNEWDPAPVSFDDYIKNKSIPQVKELLANYDLSQIWFDTPIYIPAKYSMDFYKTVYDANPEILVNARIGNGFGDIGTPGDNVIPDKSNANTWEGIATTNHTWGYSSYDHDWKSPKELMYWLVANVSKGGNFLLNVGPDGQGVIPAASANILKEVGKWLKVNGDAIYDSKPWVIDHEGPTIIDMKGTSHRKENKANFDFTEKDFWFTEKENKVYVISLTIPKSSTAVIKAIKDLNIKSIRLVGSGKLLNWSKTADAIHVLLPDLKNNGAGYAIEITQ
ncbi:alpha-L-fucosidase [Pseudocolwellia sp. AS88]|uniref:alpha-L-fucosidase n=1 Tax=Pseudocolwellia sp. AS88 TaxID=3063958 RepID=UPI0026EA1EA0|nr:alpha-L-fucosidase [Pseudocolwellia sp. AS88]MDO7085579.1 alpha-L-fucosidase [Pseudocolwellia sp. AS88]